MAAKTLTRTDEAAARPIEPAGAKSGYTNGWWAVRGNQVELHYDAVENMEEAAVAIVEAGFQSEIASEIKKIAGLPPFRQLRSLRARIAESELTINAAREKIAELKSSLGPDASEAGVTRIRKELDDCELRIREATLQRENAGRFTADAFAECERLARASFPTIMGLFRDRAANFVTHLGDQFWAVGRDFFIKMSVAEHQTDLADHYLPQVMGDVNLILEPQGWEAAMSNLLR